MVTIWLFGVELTCGVAVPAVPVGSVVAVCVLVTVCVAEAIAVAVAVNVAVPVTVAVDVPCVAVEVTKAVGVPVRVAEILGVADTVPVAVAVCVAVIEGVVVTVIVAVIVPGPTMTSLACPESDPVLAPIVPRVSVLHAASRVIPNSNARKANNLPALLPGLVRSCLMSDSFLFFSHPPQNPTSRAFPG
jgi:hypothetical protein